MGEEYKCDCSLGRGPRRWREFLAVLGLCTLLCSAFLGVLLEASNRQDLFWSRLDTLALFLVILLGAALAYVAFLLLARLAGPRFTGICSHGIFLILAAGIVQLVPQKFLEQIGWPVNVTYGATFGLGLLFTALSFFNLMGQSRVWLWQAAGGLALVFPMLFVHLLGFSPFVVREDLGPRTFAPQTATGPSVVLFIFDSISMSQCLDEAGHWRADLPATKALRSESICFDHAVSCGPGTTTSLPNLLFQRSPADFNDGLWKDVWFAADPRSFTNGIFYAAKQMGYRTGMLGVYLPFGQMFASLLDGAKDHPLTRYWAPDSLAKRCANQAICILAYARGPFNGSLIAGIPRLRHVPGWLNDGYFMQMVLRAQALVQNCLGSIRPRGQLLVSYMAIPHSPAIFLPDGTVDALRATYDSQLQYTDKVLGMFIETMKMNGTYDSCWVVVTSDHGHHGFDLPYAQHRNVPFIVKPPGGARIRPVDDPINLWELASFFRAVFTGAGNADCLAALPVELRLD